MMKLEYLFTHLCCVLRKYFVVLNLKICILHLQRSVHLDESEILIFHILFKCMKWLLNLNCNKHNPNDYCYAESSKMISIVFQSASAAINSY